MKVSTLFFRLIFITIFVLISKPVSAEICNRIVAAVNSEIITLHELNQKMAQMTQVRPQDLKNQDAEKFIEARRKILDLLIDEKISQDKIKELGINVSSKEIDSTIERIKSSNKWTHEDLISNLNSQGIRYEQYRDNLKKEIEQMRLIDIEVKSKIIIRDEVIKKYYDENIQKFRNEDRVQLATIVLINENPSSRNKNISLSKEISSRLQSGEDFAALALQYSQGPGAREGGDIGFIKTSQLDPRLKKIVDMMKIGDISKPIISPSGIQFMKLLDRQEKSAKKFEEVKDLIHDMLYREEMNNKFMAWISELRKKSYIKIIF